MKRQTRVQRVERKIVELLIAGKSVRSISEDLGVGRRRIRRVREKAESCGYLSGAVAVPVYPAALFPDEADGRSDRGSENWRALEPHVNWIQERLTNGWHAVTVYEELPVKVTRSSFYRFLEHHDLTFPGGASPWVRPEIVHEPGEALLIDWGHLWTVSTEHGRIKIWVFVAILGYSRYLLAKVMVRCDTANTLAALSEMYAQIGGVTQRTTSDNPKVFSLKACKYEPILNPTYLRFGSYYGTILECLPPREPEKKGKVERPIPYVRRLLEAYAGDRTDPKAIQAYLDAKLVIANQRRHGTTREQPIERFLNEEKPALKHLPLTPYEVESYHEGTVRLDGHVRFEGKYYSVDEKYIHKQVEIVGNSKLVSIYHQGKLLEVHNRVTDRGKTKSTKPQHLRPWQRVCDNPDGLLQKAREIGPSVELVIYKILAQGNGFIDLRKIWGILSLNKKYTAREIDHACFLASEALTFSYRAVLQFIETAREQTALSAVSAENTIVNSHKFERDISEYADALKTMTKKGVPYEH